MNDGRKTVRLQMQSGEQCVFCATEYEVTEMTDDLQDCKFIEIKDTSGETKVINVDRIEMIFVTDE